MIKNPFEKFREYSGELHGRPGATLRKRHERQNISTGISLFKTLCRHRLSVHGILVSEESIEALYREVEKITKEHVFSSGIIEDIAYEIGNEHIKNPLDSVIGGIFLSSLINNSSGNLFFLEIPAPQCILHFLGYRLPDGKTLNIDGNIGDFMGMNLSGGHISINGNVRDWAALGMKKGKITVNGSCGRFACEWMRDGEFLVAGKIESTGKILKGTVREHDKTVRKG